MREGAPYQQCPAQRDGSRGCQRGEVTMKGEKGVTVLSGSTRGVVEVNRGG